MAWWLSELGIREFSRKFATRVLPNLRYLPGSRIRRCGTCQRTTVIVAFGHGEELHVCVRCRSNLRFELLAGYILSHFPKLDELDVLELDYRSPLRPMLSAACSYIPSFYREEIPPGTRRADGAVCQDITKLTLPDQSLDLIVSSDVLEHVPDFAAALRESRRVLRPGGAHVFTVPPREKTQQRARLVGGKIEHLLEPEYHMDPLSPDGILAFWSFGPDMPEQFALPGLDIKQVVGPIGRDRRTVWEARKL